ncbi:PIN domain-containing protein [uncultured Enterovirga sp.]|uniref:PIN domain-containing protein n=1 Tax=uncultured Enterovirga sp. TaxID=2026352 RepID=UPI0035CC9475
MFVLDTDVVSRTSPVSGEGEDLGAWLMRHRGLCFVSVVTLAELHFGVDRLRLRGSTRKADILRAWLSDTERLYAARLLTVDAAISRTTGELLARAEAGGVAPGLADACIAATAELARYEVVTFNSRHFSALGVRHRTPSAEARPA